MPHAPALGVRQHDKVDEAHDVQEQKTLDHGDEQGNRQAEEVELRRRRRGDAAGRHPILLGMDRSKDD